MVAANARPHGAGVTRLAHGLACCTAVAGVVLVMLGGLVTSTGSGLAVPDWPLSFGTLLPPMVGGVAYEHGHRLAAGVVALLTLTLAGLLWWGPGPRWVARLGVATVVVVLVQAGLGGATVLLRLPVWASLSHACLAHAYVGLITSLAVVTSPAWELRWRERQGHTFGRLRRWAGLAVVAAYGQIVLGAALRHPWGGYAAHVLAHVAGAIATLGCVVAVLVAAIRSPEAGRGLVPMAWVVVALVVLQMGLGMMALAHGGSVVWSTAHVVMGTLVFVQIVAYTWGAAAGGTPY